MGRTYHRIEGTGAVGYKVYDAQGKLVMVANRHAFTIPAQLDLSQIKICVAGGDGGEVEIYKDENSSGLRQITLL